MPVTESINPCALVGARPGHRETVALYARALAEVLELDARTCMVLDDAAQFCRREAHDCEPPRLSYHSIRYCLDVRETVAYHREHWDGPDGVPGAVGGDMIPFTSRVLAVADAWAGLTARGSNELRHDQALVQLQSRAGLHFDPRVVAAVEALVSRPV
jgi:HD domain